jgi:hypothetical protein
LKDKLLKNIVDIELSNFSKIIVCLKIPDDPIVYNQFMQNFEASLKEANEFSNEDRPLSKESFNFLKKNWLLKEKLSENLPKVLESDQEESLEEESENSFCVD